MKPLIGPLAAFLAGAAAMYLLDPASGLQRRSRLAGLLGAGRVPAPGSSRALQMAQDSDAQLRDQVRNGLGRWVSHPRAIDVQVTDSVVRLSGDVLAKERDGLLSRVLDIPGVYRVINAMTAHDYASGFTAMSEQGSAPDGTPLGEGGGPGSHSVH